MRWIDAIQNQRRYSKIVYLLFRFCFLFFVFCFLFFFACFLFFFFCLFFNFVLLFFFCLFNLPFLIYYFICVFSENVFLYSLSIIRTLLKYTDVFHISLSNNNNIKIQFISAVDEHFNWWGLVLDSRYFNVIKMFKIQNKNDFDH